MPEKLDEQQVAKEMREFLRQHRIVRYTTELMLKTTVKTLVLISQGPEGLKKVNDPERMAGMMEGAIFAPRLCYPDATIGALVYKQAGAGQWLSHDFARPREFPIAAKRPDFTQNREGNLWTVIPDEIEGMPKHERTHNNFVNFFSLEHLLTLDRRKPEELIEGGFIERRSHEEAYEHAGMEEYIDDLRSRSVADDLVYQVTPKGNTLLMLRPDAGSRTPRTDAAPEFSWAKIPGLLAH